VYGSEVAIRVDPPKEMIMSIHIARLFKFAAVAAFAGTALMQGAVQGKFHLPFEARWGSTVLEPGDYSIDAAIPSLGVTEFRVIDSHGKGVFELPSYMESHRYSDQSWLKLTNVDGQYVVKEYSSGSFGRTYTFSVPKSAAQRQLSTKSTENIVALMVR
jgi:hypothetical protein